MGIREKVSARQTEEESVNKTPTPGGPIYSSANHPRGVYQTGMYGSSGSSITQTTNTYQDALMRQPTIFSGKVHPYPPGVRHGSTSSGTFQMPGQIYQATPVRRSNRSEGPLPPRFRKQQLVYHQPIPFHHQNVIQSRPKDTASVGNPVPWLPALSRPPSIQNHTFRPGSTPPPPRPYRYDVDLVFDFQGVALFSNCNDEVFVQIYSWMHGFTPSQGAWADWMSTVERLRNDEEPGTRERCGDGSRQRIWTHKRALNLPRSEPGYSFSSDASTRVPSSRTSEASDEGNVVANAAGPNGKGEVERPRTQKRWKDVADMTWAFGEPPRLDDVEYYMTHVVEQPGWQVHDAQPERIILGE